MQSSRLNLNELENNYPYLFAVINQQPDQDFDQLNGFLEEDLTKLNNLFKENKQCVELVREKKRHHPTLNEILILLNEELLNNLLELYHKDLALLDYSEISSEEFLDVMRLDTVKKNDFFRLIANPLMRRLIFTGKITLPLLMQLTPTQVQTLKNTHILILLGGSDKVEWEKQHHRLTLEQALSFTSQQRERFLEKESRDTFNWKSTTEKIFEEMEEEEREWEAKVESIDNQYQLKSKYPDLLAVIQELFHQDLHPLHNLSETSLTLLNNLFKENNQFVFFLREKKRHHPTVDEILILFNEGILINLLNIKEKKLTYLDYPHISSKEFIDVMRLDKEQRKKLFSLMTYAIRWLLYDKKITLSQIRNFTPTQIATFTNDTIQNLLLQETLTVEQALNLTPEQVIEIEKQTREGKSIVGGNASQTTQGTLQAHKEEVAPNTNDLRNQLMTDLQKYITRIQGYNGNFKHGFWFCCFRESRAANRKANFNLARTLKQQLEDNVEISEVFSSENIQDLREKPAIDRGINSKDLNRIIREARKI